MDVFEQEFSLKKTIPFFLIGVVIIFLLTAITGTDQLFAAISKVDKRIYLLAFLVQVLAIVIWLSKWKILTKAINLDVEARRMFPILLSGIFVNTAIPSAKVGGEPLRAYMFSKLGGISFEKSFATVASDRAIDGIPFIFIVLASLVVVIFAWHFPLYLVVALTVTSILVVTGIVAFLYVLLRPGPAMGLIYWFVRKLRRIITKFRPIEYVENKIEEFMEGFGKGAHEILKNKRYAFYAICLSSAYWFFTIFRMWLVFWALGEPVSLGTIGLAVSFGLILQVVPIPGGLGIVEGGYLLIFNAAGVPEGAALSVALLDRGISFWFTSVFSAAGIAWSGIKLSKTWES